MRQSEEFPLDPEMLAELDAVDATLAGEAVDPIHADLAELALLLAADRPQLDDEFAQLLDQRVARKFAPSASASSQRPARRWALRPAFGVAAAGLAAVAVAGAVVLNNNGSNNGGLPATPVFTSASGGGSAAASSAATSAPSYGASGTVYRSPAGSARQLAKSAAPTFGPDAGVPFDANSAASGSVAAVPAPAPTGRKTIQSAQLQLMAGPQRIDTVAQEVFNVVGQESGVVKRSSITATGGSDGYAVFQLSIPSGNLSDTMTRLSTLRYAHVTSRTDSTQDVNGQYLFDVRRLADARALRTSLLKQLAAATTQTQIDSLTAQIHDAEASIASDEATLRNINHQISYSNLQVSINAGGTPVPFGGSSTHHSSGFTLGKAAHDAVRVLVVAAGVALIALAAMVPLGLAVAVIGWIGFTVRRRRREHALDIA